MEGVSADTIRLHAKAKEGRGSQMNGHLTTHVLDTATGQPASGIPIEFFSVTEAGAASLISETATNRDGRTPEPLLAGERFRPGCYEIVFRVGAYFSADASIPFLDRIAIRIGISDSDRAYHVPLLVSPWSYSTYRGS
jgi:5-hydroxyisourate hydrolase